MNLSKETLAIISMGFTVQIYPVDKDEYGVYQPWNIRVLYKDELVYEGDKSDAAAEAAYAHWDKMWEEWKENNDE